MNFDSRTGSLLTEPESCDASSRSDSDSDVETTSCDTMSVSSVPGLTKTQKIVNELIETERSYVGRLRLISEVRVHHQPIDGK